MPATVVLGTAAAGGPMLAASPAPPAFRRHRRRWGLAGAGRGGRCTQRGRSGRPLRPCWAGPFPGACSAAARMPPRQTGVLASDRAAGPSCPRRVSGLQPLGSRWPGSHTAVEQALILACLAGW